MKRLKPILQLVVYLLVFYFIFRILAKNWNEIKSVVEHLNYWWIILSIITITITLVFQSYNWHLFIKSSHQTISFKESFSSFFKSMLTRYLPGGIWVFFARVYVTSKLGLSKAQVLFLIAVESAIAVASSCLVFLLIHPHIENNIYLVVLFVVLIVGSMLFLLKPNLFLVYIKMLFKKELAIVPLSINTTMTVIIFAVVQWFLFGLSLNFLAAAVPAAPTHQLLPFTGMFAASWAMGFIIIFMPSGIGVREGFLIIFLSTLMPVPLATIIALLSRIVILFGEMINFLVSLLIRTKPPNSRRINDPNQTEIRPITSV